MGTFKTPIGYYREQIETVLDDGKKYSRNDIAKILPHIPPDIITQTLGRMCDDGDVEQDRSAGHRKYVYYAIEHKAVPPKDLPKQDNFELSRIWNVAFERAEDGELR
jgi:hypothetical protein